MKAIIHTISPQGYAVDFESNEVENLAKFLETLPKVEAQLAEAGYETLTNQPAPVTVTVSGGGANAFAARELVAEVLDKKPYWKIIGAPPFNKFGLRVWPETLEAAGIEVDSLNVLEGFDLTGYTAVWEFRNNGKGGQAKVVVGLSR